jgi:hypothetical protein
MFIIGFRHKLANNDVKSHAMSLLLNSDIVHCELIFSDKKVGSSCQWLGVGIFNKDENRNPKHWEFYEIPSFYEEKAREYIQRKEGLKYNWAGIFGQMLMPIGLNSDGFCCADLCYLALKKAGLPLPNFNPESLAPSDILMMIKQLNLNKIYNVQ